MTPLAPLVGQKNPRAPTSALAAFANKWEGNGPSSPAVQSLPASSGDASSQPLPKASVRMPVSNAVQPLKALPHARTPVGELSALAAFAKKGLPPATTGMVPLADLPGAKTLKPLEPIANAVVGMKEIKVDESEMAHKQEEKSNEDADHRSDEKEETPTTPAADAKPTEDGGSEMDSRGKIEDLSDKSDGDSMAEFACMESDDGTGGEEEEQARETRNVDDLYDPADREKEDHAVLRATQRIYVPPTSKHDLFHAILVVDLELLTHTLSQMTPQDAVGILDADGRTMYHYAAMSRSPEVQGVVFDFIHCYHKQETDRQIAAIESKQRRLGKCVRWWKEGSRAHSPRSSEWTPPSIKAIRDSSELELTETYLVALRAYDCNGRSFFHYSALNHHLLLAQASRVLAKVLKSHQGEMLHKDAFERDALAYAIMADNTLAIRHWLTQLKLAFTVEDVCGDPTIALPPAGAL